MQLYIFDYLYELQTDAVVYSITSLPKSSSSSQHHPGCINNNYHPQFTFRSPAITGLPRFGLIQVFPSDLRNTIYLPLSYPIIVHSSHHQWATPATPRLQCPWSQPNCQPAIIWHQLIQHHAQHLRVLFIKYGGESYIILLLIQLGYCIKRTSNKCRLVLRDIFRGAGCRQLVCDDRVQVSSALVRIRTYNLWIASPIAYPLNYLRFNSYNTI